MISNTGIHLLFLSLYMFACINTNYVTYEYDTGSDKINISYWLITSKQNVADSEKLCNINGGTLAFIPNQQAYTIVLKLLDSKGYGTGTELYIGYKEDNTILYLYGTSIEQAWARWYSGTFGYQEPNNGYGVEECVVTYALYFWDELCSHSYNAICSNYAPSMITSTKTSTYSVTSSTPVQYTSKLFTTTTPIPTTTTKPPLTTTTTPLPTTTTTSLHNTTFLTTTLSPVALSTAPMNKTCLCSCVSSNITEELIEEFKNEYRKEIRKKLLMKKRLLSSSVCKLTSAPDSRPSSAAMGSMGVAVLSVVAAGILAADTPRAIVFIKHLYGHYV